MMKKLTEFEDFKNEDFKTPTEAIDEAENAGKTWLAANTVADWDHYAIGASKKEAVDKLKAALKAAGAKNEEITISVGPLSDAGVIDGRKMKIVK